LNKTFDNFEKRLVLSYAEVISLFNDFYNLLYKNNPIDYNLKMTKPMWFEPDEDIYETNL